MLSSFTAEAIVVRLGWVLVHSLWQFALISLFAAACVRLMRERSAAARYALLLAAMALTVLAPVVTWMVLPAADPQPGVATAIHRGNGDTDSVGAPAVEPPPMAAADPPPASAEHLPTAAAAESPDTGKRSVGADLDVYDWCLLTQDYLQPWLTTIVGVWSLGVLVFSSRPLLSWYTVRRLRRCGINAVPAAIRSVSERAAGRLGLRQTVDVLQSALVHVPVTIGYFRPVVLLPVSLVSGLPTSQLEAILAHELAHIRRHDYLVNLLQTLVETVCFYHPAVWWLSSRVRTERENCCDDLTVAALGNGVELGRALLAVEQYRGSATALALGARGGSLLNRVRRLCRSEAAKPDPGMGGIVALSTLAAAVIAMGVWAATTAGEPDAGADNGSPAIVAAGQEDADTSLPETIRVTVEQLPSESETERLDTAAFEGDVRLTRERQTLTAPVDLAWSFAKPLAVELRKRSELRVEVRFDFLGKAKEDRRIVVDMKGLDERGETLYHTWRLSGDVRAVKQPERHIVSTRIVPVIPRYSSAEMQFPSDLLPKLVTLQIGLRELSTEEIKRFPPQPSATRMSITHPDSEGRFTVSFDNPRTTFDSTRWKLDPKVHQVIFQVFVNSAEGKLQRKIFRQLAARSVGGYRVNVQVKPEYMEYSKVLVTFVTIQPDHDTWVDDFFHKGKGTKYEGIWAGDSGMLVKTPWTSDAVGWIDAPDDKDVETGEGANDLEGDHKLRQDASEDAKAAGNGRVLSFPNDSSIGRLWLYDAEADLSRVQLKDAIEAKGDIEVPPGKLVGLQYIDPKVKNLAGDQPWDLSPLDDLRPSDLDMLVFVFSRLPTDEVKRLTRHTSLRALAIGSSTMHEDAMESIGKMSSLEVLRFGEINVSDEGLKYLKDLNNLRVLAVGSAGITNDGLPHLAKLTRLEELDLTDTKIGDQGLAHLTPLRNLRSLDLSRTNVTEAGVVELRQQLPEATILSDFAAHTQSQNEEPAPNENPGTSATAERLDVVERPKDKEGRPTVIGTPPQQARQMFADFMQYVRTGNLEAANGMIRPDSDLSSTVEALSKIDGLDRLRILSVRADDHDAMAILSPVYWRSKDPRELDDRLLYAHRDGDRWLIDNIVESFYLFRTERERSIQSKLEEFRRRHPDARLVSPKRFAERVPEVPLRKILHSGGKEAGEQGTADAEGEGREKPAGAGGGSREEELKRFAFRLEFADAADAATALNVNREPKVFGAYADVPNNRVVVIAPPSSEQAIRRRLAWLELIAANDQHEFSLDRRRKQLEDRQRELLDAVATLEVLKVDLAGDPARISKVDGHIAAYGAELSQIKQKLDVIQQRRMSENVGR